MADVAAKLAELFGQFITEHPEVATAVAGAGEAAAEPEATGFYDLVRRLVRLLPPMSGPEQAAAEAAISAHEAEHEQLLGRQGAAEPVAGDPPA